MKNDIIDQAYKWWAENNYIGRDPFITIIKSLKSQDKTEITYNKNTITFYKEDWMSDISNIRDLYYSLVAVDENIQENKMTQETELSLHKRIQILSDENNKLKGRSRHSFRAINKTESFIGELVESIKLIKIPKVINRKTRDIVNKIGIIHISDLHLDMLIDEPDNKYNFNIASKRLSKFISESKKIMLDNNISKVIVVNTGDTISSNRRDSEKYNRSTSRANAVAIAVKLLSSMLLDLKSEFEVSYASCCGNESRIDMTFEYDIFSMSDNFDIMIHNMLSLIFKDDVNFIKSDIAEGVIPLDNDFNLLITHGNNIPDNNLQRKIMQLMGKFATRGININYVLFGDKHCCLISDTFARCASLCGGNAYSSKQLGFSSKASQNVYIYNKDDKSMSGTKIDVQNTTDVIGYDISEELNKFNIKEI